MFEQKCVQCIRREGCNLLDLAAGALASVALAQESPGTQWDRTHVVRRALRGNAESPGFVEDWVVDGAMSDDDVGALVDDIVRDVAVDLPLLARACRRYLGPLH